MIDGYFKATQDKFWNRVAVVFVKCGFSPNAVTMLGLFLYMGSCLWYMYNPNSLYFGISIAFIEFLDNIDGAVARITRKCSKFGAYLDAVTDRYKDAMILLAIAVVHNYWLVCFIAMVGAMVTSYNKARAAMETDISNEGWPDLFERLERIVVICTGLILTPFFSTNLLLDKDFLFWAMVVLAFFTHVSAIQRCFRGKKILDRVDENVVKNS